MTFSQRLICALCLFFALPGVSLAAVGVSSAELQEAKAILWPSSNSLGALSQFSTFQLVESSNISGGIRAIYEARLLADPWHDEELPHLNITVYSYSTQDAAHEAYNEIRQIDAPADAEVHIINQDDHYLFYQTDSGDSVDLLDSVDAEYRAYHLLHVNGNLLYQSSLYRPDEGTSVEAAGAYASAIQNPSTLYAILFNSVDTMKLAGGLLFTPTQSELSAKSEISSLNLSELYSIPQHGDVEFDLYIGESESAVGTILDSSGINSPSEGDLYLYINSDGRLFGGIYAPLFDSDCKQQGGWYRIESTDTLQSYEWNKVRLHFGVGGLAIYLNDVPTAFCHVSQPRSGNDLYFGDFPLDSLSESMAGYVNDLSIRFSTTDSGLIWDDVLTDQLFLDLPNTDPDLWIFQYLKEAGIFLGSDGVLHPDNILNRAEMVKVLLKAYEYTSEDESPSPFWDVPNDAWYLKYLNTAESIGMVEGHDDGRFLPAHELNRAEFFTMLLRISDEKVKYDDEFRDVDEEDWYADGAAFAASTGIVTESSFYPSATVSRREAAVALYQLLR